MKVKFSKKFAKQYDRANSKIKTSFDKRLKLFLQNPFHPLLNNHSLSGKLSGYRSINVTGDWRAIYSVADKSEINVVIFEMIGTHSQLYKS